MQVKSIAECSKIAYSALLSTFIKFKLPFVLKTFLPIFEWPLKTDFTVYPHKFTKLRHYILSLFQLTGGWTFSLIFVNGSAVVKCSTVKPV